MSGAAASMRESAQHLLSLLTADQLQAATYPFDAAERYRWQYTPGLRGGLWLAGMDGRQRDAALALMRTGLSEEGYATARSIMSLEPVLRDLERRAGRPGFERRDAEHYWFSVFGAPDRVAPWAWRVGGHHLCLHTTVVGDAVSATPLFFGANPATVPAGEYAGLRVLGAKEGRGRGFMLGLDDGQRRSALVSEEAPHDILTGNAARAEIAAVPTGIPVGELTASQRSDLAALVSLYTDAPALRTRVDLAAATFAWMGSTAPGRGHYYAIRAGDLFIEYDNTQNGANHVHTVVRDVNRDWGEDLLAAHYADGHS